MNSDNRLLEGLSQQYNAFAHKYSAVNDIGENSNRENRNIFYGYIDFIAAGSKVLDLGCGDGFDMVRYQGLGANVYGLDASAEMLAIARRRLPRAKIEHSPFHHAPFPDRFFDAVLSKYSIQTDAHVLAVYQEVHRILKHGGTLLMLVTHPFRQFFEKQDPAADYFEQKVIRSNIIGGAMQVTEPTHTMVEYLSPFFLEHFDLLAYDERWDRSADQIGQAKYPGFLIIKARKR